MAGELAITVVLEPDGNRGLVAGMALTDQLLVAVGGQRQPLVLASSNARHFEPRSAPRDRGLRDVLAAGDVLWACGEYGQLATSHDAGATWRLLETKTDACLFSLARAADGAIWVVGDEGFAARVTGDQIERVDLGTRQRLGRVYAVRDAVVVLGFDGNLRTWRGGTVTVTPTGATKGLTGLCVTKWTWLVVGDGGFIARSHDGTWFSRVKSDVGTDLEAIAQLADGTLVIAGDRGQILVSRDDGRTWQGIAHGHVAHLWSIVRFGGGVLIGGDDGLVLKLAPSADATWSDRINRFGGAKPLDAIFAAGPAGFLATGLTPYLDALVTAGEEDEEAEGDEDDDDDGDDDEDDEDSEDDDGEDDAEADEDGAFTVLGAEGDAASFAANYGVPLPDEAARFFAAADGRDRWSSFVELRLDNPLRPDVGEHNLFELVVRRNQKAYLGTDLVEAFCGVFGIGSQGNGDTYHMEIYPWDEGQPRQVLHFDHEEASFSGVIADSLESLAFLCALMKAHDARVLSQEAFEIGLRKLRGRVAPTWHFSIAEHDAAFTQLEPKRRDTEFFFYRSAWITALLKHDGVTDLDDIPRLFRADFNQIVPADQLAARFEACERFIPTALYAMWRAFLFDEPELARYLEIGRGHRARLVRDAARLIDELRGGRNTLGTIDDVRGLLAKFRALDLDPRRAPERTLEGQAREEAAAARKDVVAAELDRVPAAAWPALAWQWIDDGVAHRALLERLATEPQIAALDELRELDDQQREIALPRVAASLSPALEAVLVGSLLRDDALDGVPAKPDDPDELPDEPDDGDGGDAPAVGWDAIDAALEPIYHGVEPEHFGAVLPYALGGPDPIHGISAYPRVEPPHWHFVTYGFTDLFTKETSDPEVSGFGFELTMRITRDPADTSPPIWALNFLQNLGRYVFGSGNRFAVGHKMGINGPIAADSDTKLTAILFAEDPELPNDFTSEHGKARFLQIVGITDDEYKLIQEWSTTGLVEILRGTLPMLVTDLARGSVLDDAALAARVQARVAAEGSEESGTGAGDLAIEVDDGRVQLRLGALYAAAIPRAMRGRIRHGRDYTLHGREATLHLRPADACGYEGSEDDGTELALDITPALAAELERRLGANLAGTYALESWPRLAIEVTPTIIRDRDGAGVEVRGVTDPDEVQRLLELDRLARETADDADDDDDEDEDADDDDSEEEEDDESPPPSAERVVAALAMTARALRLAPDDTDTQFTHAMLLLDGDRGGVAGTAHELVALLPRCAPSVRINIAVRMGKLAHPRFAEVVDAALAEALPARILDEGGGGMVASYGDVAEELFAALGASVLAHAPDRLARLIPMLPDSVALMSGLAREAITADQREHAIALYDRIVALPIPEDEDERQDYLRALNNACVQAHAAKAYDTAVRIANRAQPVAHENPYIYHAAACAYAAVGDYPKAFAQVKLAIEHEYDHVARVETDDDLGPIREWPEFKALFREWHARQEGN